MEQLQYWMLNQELNRKLKLFEDKQQNIKYQELFSLIRWIKLVPTLLIQLQHYILVWEQKPLQFNDQLALKMTLMALLI